MRLIDADALQRKAQLAYRIALSEDDISTGKYSNVAFTDNFAVDQDDIVDAATVDAVQVTRCKDCVKRFNWNNGCGVCRMIGQNMNDADFCSYGEKGAT